MVAGDCQSRPSSSSICQVVTIRVALQGQHIALVGSDEEIRFTDLDHRQQIVIPRVGRDIDRGQVLQLVVERAGRRRLDARPDPGVTGDPSEFLQLLIARYERKQAIAPGEVQPAW